MRKRPGIHDDYAASLVARVMGIVYRQGMTTSSGGNISLKDEDGNIWITPAAKDKGSLKASDIACVRRDGTVTGKRRPSSEYLIHKAVYDARPDLKALIHVHPPAVVSFSITHRVPDTSVLRYALDICGPAGYASYELPGSELLGRNIASEFMKGHKAVIMENHAAIAGGRDLSDALDTIEALEYCARTVLSGMILENSNHPEETCIDGSVRETFTRLPGTAAGYPLPGERQQRREICNIVHRACLRGLIFSRSGTVSVRLKDDDLLITPGEISRREITEEDIVKISGGSNEAGKKPSADVMLHRQIYKRFPAINSIIQAAPPYLMAFGISATGVNVRTIPESWIFLQDIPAVSRRKGYDDNQMITDMIKTAGSAVLIRNDSIVITGDRLFDSFDRLEIAEMNAMSLVMAKPAGEIIPLSNDQISSLKKEFLKNQY
jgi:L-fuculose-phosphate aldolase